ncbi:TetR/AcrR family transcriptional regulator [Plantactinospora endophytica]|uniref:TetR family transcriptional regulator n=1 Tax=Plantactinospora endophytica TaxID=673535 RepID=A0ABQ4E5A6_9ACTN|nr:TetR/AcrR family transcriptional regulator C-terminal domain-containing protein [Plantactinospora endophytica]GIG89507.1 TetR family transcriptional regulator [Plantactinospora endophytica]
MTVERSGGGDPRRTLALLWTAEPAPAAAGTTGRPARGRPPRLTVRQIRQAAIAVADRDGLAAMSMARVADGLGVGTMSLYTYVPGKAELIDLMVDGVLAERELPGPDDAPPPDWRARIELYADRTRATYLRHPWLREVSTVRPPLGPGLLAQQEYLLAALAGLGLPARQTVAAANAIVTFVDASARQRAETDQLERVTGQSTDEWWSDRDSFWSEHFDVARHPAMNRIWLADGFVDTPDAMADAYRFGLRLLLDGIQRTVEAADR